MLKIELNLEKIKANNKNQLKVDDNFIVKYAKIINYFGSIIVSNCTSYSLLKELCSVAECYLMINSSDSKFIKKALKLGIKKIIIPYKEIKKISQKISKNVIIARITLPEKYFINNMLPNIREEIREIFNDINSNCSEFLVDFDDKLNLDKNTLLTTINYITEFNKSPLTFLDPNGKNSDELEKKGISPFITSSNMLSEEELSRLFISIIDFQKQKGLIPTIVQDVHNQVLMLAYSSQDSLTQALTQKKGTYYSRSRQSIWIKGETSGNYQELCQTRYDCDQDTILFTVRQSGVACHLNRYSCFGDKKFDFSDLYEIIQDRIKNPVSNSYTSKISKEEKLIIEKIREESNEVINYTDKENLTWEIADLFYFILVLMAKKEIKIQDILNELWKRRNYR